MSKKGAKGHTFAMVCHSNNNRSMEGHRVLKEAGCVPPPCIARALAENEPVPPPPSTLCAVWSRDPVASPRWPRPICWRQRADESRAAARSRLCAAADSRSSRTARDARSRCPVRRRTSQTCLSLAFRTPRCWPRYAGGRPCSRRERARRDALTFARVCARHGTAQGRGRGAVQAERHD